MNKKRHKLIKKAVKRAVKEYKDFYKWCAQER